MAHETKLVSGKGNLHGHIKADIGEENKIPKQSKYYDRMAQVMEKFACTNVGQMVLYKTDRVLKVVEDTAKWSLPQDDPDIVLERPLPWILFLTLIVWMRIFRIWLSIGFYMVGSQPVTPHSIVYYLQNKRHRLRDMQVQGIKLIRNEEMATTSAGGANKNSTFFGKLLKLFKSAICKPEQYPELLTRCVLTKDVKSVKDSSELSTKIPEDDNEDEDEDDTVDKYMSVSELLEKFAEENSADDSDYIPKEDDTDNDDDDSDISTSHTNSLLSDELENDEPEALSEPYAVYRPPSKSPKATISGEQNKGKIELNGQTVYNPAKKVHTKIIHPSSGIDCGHVHKKTDTNGVAEAGAENRTPAATREVAPQGTLSTPNTVFRFMAAPQVEESEKKSTPGHVTAASLKPSIASTSTAGSHQDFHSVFHPVSITRDANGEDQTSTSKGADQYRSNNSSAETLETLAAGNQKKHFNHTTHNKHYHHNAKNYNKNRR